MRSTETLALTLPIRIALETETLLLPNAPYPTWLRKDVSDSQLVASHPVLPARTVAEAPASPMLAPFRVMLKEPLDARFPRRDALTLGAPNVKPRDLLPACKPTVSAARLLPSVPYPAWQRVAVSEIHPVLSHAVCPALTPPLIAASPMLPPCTVTLIDPETTMFPCPPLLSHPTENDSTMLMLETRVPADIAPRLLRRTLPLARPLADVSDCQVVRSHELCPTLNAAHNPADPSPAPCTVTLSDPDVAPLAPMLTLTAPDANDTLRDTLPIRPPVVITAFRLPDAPPPPLQRTDVSASQIVASHPVEPIRSPPEYIARPMLPPRTVTLLDPLDAAFACMVTLKDTPSVEYSPLAVPTLAPIVIDTR